jgi:2-polyprenyl-3-methyl-5-hydroxy-6-metoxy-1,4-benzoquinol methylase
MATCTHINVHCVCQSDDYRVLFPPGVAQVNQIVRCNRCGMMYANPRAGADIARIQSDPDDPNWDIAKEFPHYVDKQLLQVRDYTGTKAFLNKLYPQRGRIVEVGSSLGFLLDSFRKDGWDVFGVEPDRNMARYANEHQGIPTVASALEDAGIADESFDVVLMMHVIEHVPDPLQILTEIRRILKPGGYLVMETPRYDTLMFRLLGRRERSLRCDGHVWFFTTESLRNTYERAGLETVRLQRVGRSLTLDRLVHNIGVVTHVKALRVHETATRHGGTLQHFVASVSRRLGLPNWRLHINLRDMQRVVVRKPAGASSPPA